MKNCFYQHFTFVALFLLTINILTSCQRSSTHTKDPIVVTHEFAATNWTFDEQTLNMDFTITDTAKHYSVEFYLTYDTAIVEIAELPVNITLTAPDGMETFVSSTLNFDRKINKNITPNGNNSVYTMKLVAYPNRKFNQSGKYSATFYRKSPKYDNYGMHSLTMKVVPIKGK